MLQACGRNNFDVKHTGIEKKQREGTLAKCVAIDGAPTGRRSIGRLMARTRSVRAELNIAISREFNATVCLAIENYLANLQP